MAIPTVTLRNTKGSALTFTEADTNFQNLANATVNFTAGGTTSNIALNGALTIANTGTVGASLSGSTLSLSADNWTANVGANGQYLTNVVFNDYREKTANTGPFTGTLSINANTATIQTGAVTGSITLNTNNLSNLSAGESVTLLLYATGNFTLTSNLKFLSGTKTISTTAGNVDALTVFYDGTTYFAALAKYW